jgi:hypothetical protein
MTRDDLRKYTGIERRDTSETGKLRRMEEKNIWNCERCFPHLCKCEDRKIHGTHKSRGTSWGTL